MSDCIVCGGDNDPYEMVAATVQEHGWAAVGVDDDPAFTYTVGHMPYDLIIRGIGHYAAHGIITNLIEHFAVPGGLDIEDHDRIPDIIEGYNLELETLPVGIWSQYAKATYRYNQHAVVRQIIWPDAQGRFPGEPGCDVDGQRLITSPMH